jgi:hypothetical protein
LEKVGDVGPGLLFDALLVFNVLFHIKPFVFAADLDVKGFKYVEGTKLQFGENLVKNGKVFEVLKQEALLEV